MSWVTLHTVYYREREPSVSVNYALVWIFLCQFLASRLLSTSSCRPYDKFSSVEIGGGVSE